MDIKTGDIFEDMAVVGERIVKARSGNREFNSTRILCTCRVCGRDKIFQKSALSRHVGTSHRMCNHDETEKIKKAHPEFYRCWNHIRARINNPNIAHFDRYGGRGLANDYEYFVDFCDDLFESYLEHVNTYGLQNTTVERIENNLGYVRGNIRWATWKEQAVNRCTTRKYEIFDILTRTNYSTNNLKEFCETHGINHKALHMAISRGQDIYKGRWRVVRY